jgi:hypothetical protein
MLRFESDALLCLSCHTVRTVTVFFVVLVKTSDPIAVIPSRFSALRGYAVAASRVISPVAPSLVGSSIFLSTIFSNVFSLCYCRATGQEEQSNKAKLLLCLINQVPRHEDECLSGGKALKFLIRWR